MRAAVLEQVGAVPVAGDFRDPEPGDGHEVVDVVVAGLNPVDLYIAAGQYGPVSPPLVVGLEGIGRRSSGERVYFNGSPPPFGSLAERAPVDPASLFPVPDDLDDGVAVALGIAGLAAWLPLAVRAQLQPGESVLVLAASGVVGTIGVQAARALGAGRVVAAARHRPSLERLRESGAADDIVVLEGDLGQALKAAAGDGFDVVLDPLFGPAFEAALGATAVGARIVTVGAGAGMTVELGMGSLIGRTVIGHSNAYLPLDVRREAYERMAGHAAAGEISVDVERVALGDVAQAWERQASGPHQKVVVVP
jgi:NADPH2:quinone reductase